MCRSPLVQRRQSSGFTLVELAVVLAIVGLLLGIVLVPLGTQFDLREVRDEEESLKSIRETLLGFLMTRGRLPCPDNNNDGLEDFTAGTPNTCTGGERGELPYLTLGIGVADTWGRRYRYEVDPDFVMDTSKGALPSGNFLDMTDASNITIVLRQDDKTTVNLAAPGATRDGASAVVVSFGDNGNGGRRAIDGVLMPAPVVGSDEEENANADSTYLMRNRSEEPSGACSETVVGTQSCAYDDLMFWLPGDLVRSRLVAAEWLP